MDNLRERKKKLNDAFVYQSAIDPKTYGEMKDQLDEQILRMQMELSNTQLNELDVEAVLNFGESLLVNASNLWLRISLDQKQRLQSVLFPRGISFDGEVYKTQQTCLLFNGLGIAAEQKEQMVALPGIEPGF